MSGNKLSPIKSTYSSLSTAKTPLKTNLQNRPVSQFEEPIESLETNFDSNSIQNLQTTTILEEKEEETLEIQNLKKNEAIQIEIKDQVEITQPIEKNQIIEPEPKNSQLHISFILPEAQKLPNSAIDNKNKSALTVENTQLEIDPRILEEEKLEEELLKKEIEEEKNELKKKQEEEKELKKRSKEDLIKAEALNDMLSKKHYQSTVSISNISIGDPSSFDMIAEKQAIKKKERFILNRHNYHHPRKPKNNLIELYKQGIHYFFYFFKLINIQNLI
jgi:hypothetical protein